MARKALLLAGILGLGIAASATWLTSQASTSPKHDGEPAREPINAQEQSVQRGRLALLLANSNYVDAEAPLAHSLEDARALGDELQRNGFGVTLKHDATKQDMKAAIDEFIAGIQPGSTALLFF